MKIFKSLIDTTSDVHFSEKERAKINNVILGLRLFEKGRRDSVLLIVNLTLHNKFPKITVKIKAF